MTPAIQDYTDPNALPLSQGKLKAMWDAIRTTPPDQPATPAPNLNAAVQAVPASPPPPPPGAGPVTTPQGAPALPPPPTGMVPPQTVDQQMSVLPPLPQSPTVYPAQVDQSTLPGSARVDTLQSKLDAANAPPTVKSALINAAPIGASLLAALIGHGQAASSIQGVNEGMQANRVQSNANRANLTQQLGSAQQEREKEFDTAEKLREQAIASTEANKTRETVARVLGGSREAVADTNAGARRDVATTQGGTARDVAGTRAASAKTVAEIAADARIRAGKYAADAAANRQTRSLAASASRQQRGFDHTNEKPTADEDRRADLAKSLSDIGDHISETITRRPELAGKFAGRFTALRNQVGTDDPDIATLMADKEALGQIALGAHAMRNASHIAVAANSIINGFNNSPQAIVAAIEQAKKNANTMNTVVRPTIAGRVGTSTPTSKSAPTSKSSPTSSGKKGDPLGLF